MATRGTLVERFFRKEDPEQTLRQQRYRIPLHILRNFESDDTDGRTHFQSPNDNGRVVAYDVGTEEIHRFTIWEAFAENDIYEPYFETSGSMDKEERYESWKLLLRVDRQIHTRLEEMLRLVFDMTSLPHTKQIEITREQHNDLRKALFLMNSLWGRDRTQHLLKGTGLLPNAKKRMRDFRREMGLERTRDVWLANVCRMLEAENYDISRNAEVFDLDRDDFHANARERFMVIYQAGDDAEFLCTDTSFGVFEETELGADESRTINMTPLEHEQRVYTRDHAWHQIFVLSPKLAIVLAHGSLMNPELAKQHCNRYGLRRSVLADLPHPIPHNYYKDLTKDEAGFAQSGRLPQEIEKAFGLKAFDGRVVAIDNRSADRLAFKITRLDTKQVACINSIVLQNQQFGKVDLVLFRWPSAHDSIVDGLDLSQKLNGEGRSTEPQNNYRKLKSIIAQADQNRSRPSTAAQPPQYFPPSVSKKSPPPILEPAPKGRGMSRRKSVHHPYDTPPITPQAEVPRMNVSPTYPSEQHLRPSRERAQTASNGSRSAGEPTKVSARPDPPSRRETRDTAVPAVKQETRRNGDMRPPPVSHRESHRSTADSDERERPSTARRDTASSRDTARPTTSSKNVAQLVEAADQRAYHAHQIADEKRRNAELEAARQQKFEARRLEAEQQAKERLRNAEMLKEQEKQRQYEAARKAAEEKKAEEQRLDEERRRAEERRLQEAKAIEEARQEEMRQEEAKRAEERRQIEEERRRVDDERRRADEHRRQEEHRRRVEEEEARKEAAALAESARLREIRLKEKMEQRQQELRRQEAAEQEAAREATRQQELKTKAAALEQINRRKAEERAAAERSYDSNPMRSPTRPRRAEREYSHRDSRPLQSRHDSTQTLQLPPLGQLRLEPPRNSTADDDHLTRLSDTSSKLSKSSTKSDPRIPSSKTSSSEHEEPKTPVIGKPAGGNLKQVNNRLSALIGPGTFGNPDVAESMIVEYDDDTDQYSENEDWDDSGYAEVGHHDPRRMPVSYHQVPIARPSQMRRESTSSSKKSSSTAKPSKKRDGRTRVVNSRGTGYY